MRDLILLHGALGSAAMLTPLASHLESTYTIHNLEFDGHGASVRMPERFSIDLFAQNLSDYIQARNLVDVLVFGYSMGGYVAMHAALSGLDSIKGLVTLGTKLDWQPEQATKEAARLNPEKLAEKVPKYAASLLDLHGQRWPQVCQRTAEMMLTLGSAPLLRTDNVVGLPFPVRFCVGDRDAMVSVEETAAFYRASPGASLEVYPHTPHPLERVDIRRIAASLGELASQVSALSS